jgi:aerobic carbon-monoxide dehydrogenase medium subunit
MKPPPFRYVRATSLEQAIGMLTAHPGVAKILAGGQSLMPMLNFRLLEPDILVDINGIPDMKGISEAAGHLRIGALTRHREVEASPLIARHFPVLAAAIRHVAHMTIRNRGTFAGSLAHADPAAELPMMAMLLDARILLTGPKGERVLTARDFFVAALTTALQDNEIVTAIELPLLRQPSGWAFEEVARRAGDYALAAAGVTLSQEQGRIRDVRIALAGVDQTPIRATTAEAGLHVQSLDADAIAQAAKTAAAHCDPPGDLHASADYRRHLVEVLVRRCLVKAQQRLQASLQPEARP